MAALRSNFSSDADFLAGQFASIPQMMRRDAKDEYFRKYKINQKQAKIWLQGICEFVNEHAAHELTMSDRQLCNRAAILSNNPITSGGKTARQIRRDLRRDQGRSIEKLAYRIGMVGTGLQEYASRQTVARRANQKQRWERFAEATMLNFGEKRISLSQILTDNSRRSSAEKYHWLKALQAVAEQDGLGWSMWTLTAPPEFHPSPSHGESCWDVRTDPRQAHAYISKQWRRVRASLAKRGIKLSGLRVTEPHKDGCAHWHLAVFYRNVDASAVREAFRRHWPTEAGANEIIGDPDKGSFSSYIFKYIGKINPSAYSKDDEKNGDHFQCVAGLAADAWRSTWGIRACQFFGIPSLQLWRELRSQDSPPTVDSHKVTALWHAARSSDATTFIRLSGGLSANQQSHEVRPLTHDPFRTIDEVLVNEPGDTTDVVHRLEGMEGSHKTQLVTVIQSYPRIGGEQLFEWINNRKRRNKLVLNRKQIPRSLRPPAVKGALKDLAVMRMSVEGRFVRSKLTNLYPYYQATGPPFT